jgi:hypothetical protein
MGQLAPHGLTSWNIPQRGYAISGDAGRGSQGPANVKPTTQTYLPDWGLILGSAAPSPRRKAEINPLPGAASYAVASAKALLLSGASRRVSCRSCASLFP